MALLVLADEADGMVSGCITTTAHTIRPALEVIRTVEGVSVVSSVFFMLLEDRVLVYGDCAVNPNPNAEQLADIAKASAQTARAFGVDPRVAMLSYSTGSSGSGEDVEGVTGRSTVLSTGLTGPDGEPAWVSGIDLATAAAVLRSDDVARKP